MEGVTTTNESRTQPLRNPSNSTQFQARMTVHEISQVYGFTVKNPELLKLLLAKLAENPEWAGHMQTMEPECAQEDTDDEEEGEESKAYRAAEYAKEREWTHNGLLYQFYELPHFFGRGPKAEGLDKARELFPDLPEGIRLFYNPMDHVDTWHLGVEVSYMETGWSDKRKKVKPLNPVKLAADHSATLAALQSKYGHLLKEETPVIFEVTDDCACCS